MSTNTSNTMNLTPEQVTRIKSLMSHMRQGTTFAEACERLMDQGLYQFEYRYSPDAKETRKAYAQKKAAEDKLARDLYKKAQTDPELAVRLGLGKRVEL